MREVERYATDQHLLRGLVGAMDRGSHGTIRMGQGGTEKGENIQHQPEAAGL